MSNTLNTPIEAFELEYPMRVERYELLYGSGGEGEHRGGDGIVRSVRVLEPASLSLLTDRRRHPPRGANGGGPGKWAGTSSTRRSCRRRSAGSSRPETSLRSARRAAAGTDEPKSKLRTGRRSRVYGRVVLRVGRPASLESGASGANNQGGDTRAGPSRLRPGAGGSPTPLFTQPRRREILRSSSSACRSL